MKNHNNLPKIYFSKMLGTLKRGPPPPISLSATEYVPTT